MTTEGIKEEAGIFQKKRLMMMLLNLAYFVILLGLGMLMFFSDFGGTALILLIAAAVIFYLAVVRPVSKRYEYSLREAILKHTVMERLSGAEYERLSGVPKEYLTDAGFVNAIGENGYLSREKISGEYRKIHVEMADVTFPFSENGLNKMFNGCLFHLVKKDAGYGQLEVKAGELKHLPEGREKELLKKIGDFIPGSLYVHREGDKLDVLLRARFLGFQINPLGEVHESTLMSDPMPELKEILELAEIRSGGRIS